jgi:hypothetical protein
MSETILKILASELETLRITCLEEKCGAVVELPVSRLHESSTKEVSCPMCRAKIRSSLGTDPLSKLASALHDLKNTSGVEVSFILRKQHNPS